MPPRRTLHDFVSACARLAVAWLLVGAGAGSAGGGAGAAASDPAFARTGDLSATVRQLHDTLLQVAADPRHGGGWGTAVRIDTTLAVTNCHVVGEARELRLLAGARAAVPRPEPPPGPGQGPGNRGHVPAEPPSAPVLAGDRHHDLCLIRVPAGPFASLRPSRSVQDAEASLALGYAGGRFGFSAGLIERRFPMEGGVVLQTGAVFAPGASGGGLFDGDGRLIGVLSFFHREPRGTSHFAVPSEWIDELLANWRAGRTASVPADGPFWERGEGDPAMPDFVRALRLEARGDWAALAAFASEWQQRAPGDDAARRAAALAEQHLRDDFRGDRKPADHDERDDGATTPGNRSR